jgi:hypothetical protein
MEDTMIKHYVTFTSSLSPGHFICNLSTREIDSWNVEKAIEMSKEVIEQYSSPPFCFYFTTRMCTDDESGSKVVKKSGKYFLGGTIKTIDDVAKENGPENAILLFNMRVNKWDRVVETKSPWSWTSPFEPDDAVLPVE